MHMFCEDDDYLHLKINIAFTLYYVLHTDIGIFSTACLVCL